MGFGTRFGLNPNRLVGPLLDGSGVSGWSS